MGIPIRVWRVLRLSAGLGLVALAGCFAAPPDVDASGAGSGSTTASATLGASDTGLPHHTEPDPPPGSSSSSSGPSPAGSSSGDTTTAATAGSSAESTTDGFMGTWGSSSTGAVLGPPCGPLLQDCGVGACYPGGGAFACQEPDPDAGVAGDPCGNHRHCQLGSFCHDSECVEFCGLDGGACSSGSCMPLADPAPGHEDVGQCP